VEVTSLNPPPPLVQTYQKIIIIKERDFKFPLLKSVHELVKGELIFQNLKREVFQAEIMENLWKKTVFLTMERDRNCRKVF
jgi:hypothetical protein